MSRAYVCTCACPDCKSIRYNGSPGIGIFRLGMRQGRKWRAHCGRAFKGCLA